MFGLSMSQVIVILAMLAYVTMGVMHIQLSRESNRLHQLLEEQLRIRSETTCLHCNGLLDVETSPR